jgi:hypothetical protein
MQELGCLVLLFGVLADRTMNGFCLDDIVFVLDQYVWHGILRLLFFNSCQEI